VVAAALLLAWLITASGTRDPDGSSWEQSVTCSSTTLLHGYIFYFELFAGLAAADALAGVGGTALLLLAAPGSSGSFASGLLFLFVVVPLFVAASLQLELAGRFAPRSVALILTALVTIATLVQASAPSSLGVGGLLFPVGGVVRAAEEPLGLELAARATLPGVLYDLALFAALLALRPIRARGIHADRDRQ